jgi:AAA domain (dynein-related subfamily)
MRATITMTMVMLGQEPYTTICSSCLCYTQDYFGSSVPCGNGAFELQKGALVRAMENGHAILLDELNLAPAAVLNEIAPLLEGCHEVLIPGTNHTIHAKAGFQVYATQNPGGNTDRQKLPQSLRSRFVTIQFDQPTESEVMAMLMHRSDLAVTATAATQLARVYTALAKETASLSITLRELIKWITRFNKYTSTAAYAAAADTTSAWMNIGAVLLAPRLTNGNDMTKFITVLQQAFNAPSWRMSTALVPALDQHCDVSQMVSSGAAIVQTATDSITIAIGGLQQVFKDCVLTRSPIWSNELPASFIHSLAKIFFATDSHEPVLLVGATAYKSLLVDTYTQITGRSSELVRCYLSIDTEAADLLG